MYEKIVKYLLLIIIGLFFLFTVSTTGWIITYNRLEQNRQQLEHARMEYDAAIERQYRVTEILSRDSEIIGESATTIAGIRSQIAVVRESYEEMANILYNNVSDSNR